MKNFISCDWGTSSFRLRLIDADTRKIIAEITTTRGVAATFDLWKKQSGIDRTAFYAGYINEQAKKLQLKSSCVTPGFTIVVSGMASASIGMLELPYTQLPFNVKNTELITQLVPASSVCPYNIIIISGVRSFDDVMRGEETMLVGCSIAQADATQLFIFPGTHSKHVTVQNGVMKGLKTYMTGELFKLLSTESILKTSVEQNADLGRYTGAFIKGLNHAFDSNILNSLFHVRTNYLFSNLSKAESYHFLSGLLIGEELKTLVVAGYDSITIVSAGKLGQLYSDALLELGFEEKLKNQNADEALINGQAIILHRYHCAF